MMDDISFSLRPLSLTLLLKPVAFYSLGIFGDQSFQMLFYTYIVVFDTRVLMLIYVSIGHGYRALEMELFLFFPTARIRAPALAAYRGS